MTGDFDDLPPDVDPGVPLVVDSSESYLRVQGIEEWILRIAPPGAGMDVLPQEDYYRMQDIDTKAVFEVRRIS